MNKVMSLAAAMMFAVAMSARADDPDPMEILAKVDKATKAVTALQYDGEFLATGSLAERMPKVTGKVRAKGPRKSGPIGRLLGGGSAANRLAFEADIVKPGSKKAWHVVVSTDGTNAYQIDPAEKTYTHGKLPAAGRLLGDAQRLFMIEFLHQTPFSDELNGKSAKYEGTKTIGDVECDVIYVVYNAASSEARWYFGKKDHLPRRVDRIGLSGNGDYSQIVKNLNVDPDFDNSIFSPEVPDGYEKKEFSASVAKRRDLLKVGAAAPDWELKTPEGKTVTLQSLRGQIVLLDFWATWCGPCKKAMPGIQKLHEKFEGKPVKIIGISCKERENGDPAGYMKKQGFTYMLLVGGTEVANEYKVTGIPTFYIVGPDGKIMHAARGFAPGRDEELSKIIEKNIPKTEL